MKSKLPCKLSMDNKKVVINKVNGNNNLLNQNQFHNMPFIQLLLSLALL